MVRVVPAILTDDPDEAKRLFRLARSFSAYTQLDVMDGIFVPTYSIRCEDINKAETPLHWEVHLMVKNPENYLRCYHNLGAEKIIFHLEATDVPSKVIRKAKEIGIRVGIAINPQTPIHLVQDLLPEIDSILFLSVEPGSYGSKFIPSVLDKIQSFKTINTSLHTGIDGGIKEENIAEIAKSGIDDICVGSGIFRADDPTVAFHRLSRMVI
jgi:ribulose-phosphate 3-epimerase